MLSKWLKKISEKQRFVVHLIANCIESDGIIGEFGKVLMKLLDVLLRYIDITELKTSFDQQIW